MSFLDAEHYSRVLSGFESINQHIETGCGLTPDGDYAFTVLKLHAQDAGYYAGQEGFLDNVKKGAKNAKEWIIKFIKAIFDYITSGKKKSGELIKHSETNAKAYNELKDDKQKEEFSNVVSIFGSQIDRAIFEAEGFESAANSDIAKQIKYSGSPDKIVSELKAAKSKINNSVDFNKHLAAASMQIYREMSFWNSRLDAFMREGSDRDHDRIGSEATNVVKWLGKADGIVTKLIEAGVTRQDKVLSNSKGE